MWPFPASTGSWYLAAPWEGRAFGMAIALMDGGQYRWEEFRDRLIIEVALAVNQAEPAIAS